MMWPFGGLRSGTRRNAASPADAHLCVALTPAIDYDDKLIPMFLASYSSLFTDVLTGERAGPSSPSSSRGSVAMAGRGGPACHRAGTSR
jgi:hypothetical protein